MTTYAEEVLRATEMWSVTIYDRRPNFEQDADTYGPFTSRDAAYKWGFRVVEPYESFEIRHLQDPMTHRKERA